MHVYCTKAIKRTNLLPAVTEQSVLVLLLQNLATPTTEASLLKTGTMPDREETFPYWNYWGQAPLFRQQT